MTEIAFAYAGADGLIHDSVSGGPEGSLPQGKAEERDGANNARTCLPPEPMGYRSSRKGPHFGATAIQTPFRQRRGKESALKVRSAGSIERNRVGFAWPPGSGCSDQAVHKHGHGRRPEYGANDRDSRSDRGFIRLSDGHVKKETARLGEDAHNQSR